MQTDTFHKNLLPLKVMKAFMFFFLLISVELFAQADFSFMNNNSNVKVELLSQRSSVQPGEDFWLGVKFDLKEKWHIYWRNVGDTGLATSVEWELPEGVQVSDLQWPVPERFETAGLVSYGYHDQTMLLVKASLDPNRTWSKDLTLKANVRWLECKETCLPGKSSVQLTLPIHKKASNDSTTSAAKLFKSYLERLPVVSDDIYAYKKNDGFVVGIQQQGSIKKIDFFPHLNDDVSHGTPPVIEILENVSEIRLKFGKNQPKQIQGVLRIEKESTIHAYLVDTELLASAPNLGETNIKRSEENEKGSFISAILFAFLGGLILNIMPCVLPVLSVKILQILSHANDSRAKIFLNAMSYTLGVLVSFWLLAGVLIALRHTGEELGWGFQMQSPVMLTILMGIFFIFGLNLFGVFEIGVGLVGVDQKAKSHSGYLGAFLSGVLATVAATPCTAPYMGTALAYAITQPVLEAMSVFTGLGLGMASPFILAGIFPGMMKFLPKPGAWMNTFKQFLGFLLMATVAYLFYVYTTVVTDSERVLWMGICLVLFSMAAWVWGKWAYTGPAQGWLAKGMAFLLILSGFLISDNREKAYTWETYNADQLAQHLEKGRPVFLDFTASWCLSCKVNEKTVLDTETTAVLFDDYDIIPMKADWSQYSPEITKALEALGRNSVPVYALYNPKKPNEPHLLPEVLTHGILKEAIQSLKQ